MKYYNDEIERLLISVFNSELKFKHRNSLNSISEKTGIDVDDIADSLLETSLKVVKSNEFKKRYRDKFSDSTVESLFLIYFDQVLWYELHNIKHYLNNSRSEMTGVSFYNTEKAEMILKPAKRNTLLKQLI
jgi:hypothetical protein